MKNKGVFSAGGFLNVLPEDTITVTKVRFIPLRQLVLVIGSTEMTYNNLLNQCIAIAGWVRKGKEYFGKGRMRDGQLSLDKSLTIMEEIIKELQKRPEVAEEDIWRDV